jgi:hypothetical protein
MRRSLDEVLPMQHSWVRLWMRRSWMRCSREEASKEVRQRCDDRHGIVVDDRIE